MRIRIVLGALFFTSALLAACAINTEKPVRSDEPVETSDQLLEPIGDISEFAPEETLEPVSAEMSSLIRHAIADLALRTQVSEEAIEVLGVEAVEWPNTSLGCPQPGMMYAQLVTTGFLLVLESGGEEYEYHTDEVRIVMLCEETRTLGEGPSQGFDSSVQDGWPNESRDYDVTLVPPTERK